MSAVRAFYTPYYAQPQRHYHTLDHIKAMLDALRERNVLIPALELAVWGHDLIYDPARQDNEERSAAVFGIWLTEQGAPSELRQEVEALILATRHDAPPVSPAALIVDADLSVFGASDEAFWTYEGAIRQEYLHVPWPAYQAGRRAVLHHFLNRERIYTTPEFANLEVAARAHLAAALEALERLKEV